MRLSMSVRLAGILAALSAMLGVGLVGASQSMASTYSPGTATAYKPVYSSANGGQWNYHCGYDHWRSGAKVVWDCKLYLVEFDELGFIHYYLQDKHSGSWTPSPASHTTRTFTWPFISGYTYCVRAHAHSVDGGATSKYACH